MTVAYGQNGEPVRPDHGFQLRLLVPGSEGIYNVKWLKRIRVVDQPCLSFQQQSRFLTPDPKTQRDSYDFGPNSVITQPSGAPVAAPGVPKSNFSRFLDTKLCRCDAATRHGKCERSTTRSRGPVAATPVRVASHRNDARRTEKPAVVNCWRCCAACPGVNRPRCRKPFRWWRHWAWSASETDTSCSRLPILAAARPQGREGAAGDGLIFPCGHGDATLGR